MSLFSFGVTFLASFLFSILCSNIQQQFTCTGFNLQILVQKLFCILVQKFFEIAHFGPKMFVFSHFNILSHRPRFVTFGKNQIPKVKVSPVNYVEDQEQERGADQEKSVHITILEQKKKESQLKILAFQNLKWMLVKTLKTLFSF